MAHKSTRIITDLDDTLFITRWENGSVDVMVIDHDTHEAMELSLSQRDIAEIADVIHGHGDESESER